MKTLEDKQALPEIRKFAISSLVKKRETACIPIFIKIAKDSKEDESIRKRVIAALGELKAVEGVVPLSEVLKDKKDSDIIKIDIINFLKETGGEEAKRGLIEAIPENLRSPAIPIAASNALGKMKGKIPVEELGPALMCENEEIVKAVLILIKTAKDASALPVMMPALDKKKTELKIEIISVAAELGGSDIIPVLILRLDDNDAVFRAFLAGLLNKKTPKPMKAFYYNELNRIIGKESDKKIKETLIQAKKRLLKK